MPKTSPELAGTLSFWVPGLGQFYARSPRRGLMIFAATTLLTALAWGELSPHEVWTGRDVEKPPAALTWWGASIAIWLWNIPDASRAARSRSLANDASRKATI